MTILIASGRTKYEQNSLSVQSALTVWHTNGETVSFNNDNNTALNEIQT